MQARQWRRSPLIVALTPVLAVALVDLAPAPTPAQAAGGSPRVVSAPGIVSRPIPFGHRRKRETAAYAKRHYGVHTWSLTEPQVIVEHYTGGHSFRSAWNTFASNERHLGERPGVCAHFVIDSNGKIYQLVDTSIICRHTVGLNYTAIGIEHVGTSDGQILHDRRQIRASLHLTVWLMQEFGIALGDVIGHAESLRSSFYRERVPAYRCQTHSDWRHRDMRTYRRKLARLASSEGVPRGHGYDPVSNGC